MLPSLGWLNASDLSLGPTETAVTPEENAWLVNRYGKDWAKPKENRFIRQVEARNAIRKEAAQRKARADAVEAKRRAAELAEKRAGRIVKYGPTYESESERLPTYDDLHAMFPINVRTAVSPDFWFVGSDDATLVHSRARRQLVLSSLVGDDIFFFSCVPEWNDGRITASRFEPTRQGGAFPHGVSAEKIVDDVTDRFSWKYGDRCGSSNCFYPNQRVDVLETLLYAMKPFAPYDTAIPSNVSVRAPKYKGVANQRLWEKTFDEFTELFLTLRMASHGLTPPLYLAVPVRLDELDVRGNFGFCYFTESGWMDLGDALSTFTSDDEPIRMGTAIIKCLQLTSQQFVILTDIKSGNMVAKKSGDSFDVRMIDFDGSYTIDINLYPEVPKTTSDCVFFVNALLLLSTSVYAPESTRKAAFTDLALEVTAMWRAMEWAGTTGAFCALLARDKKFGENAKDRSDSYGILDVKPENKMRIVTEDEFLSKISALFYERLDHYGSGSIVLPWNDGAEPNDPESYIERLLARLASKWSLEDARIVARATELVSERLG